MYDVIGSVTSRAFRVLWALEELEVPYTLTYASPGDETIRAVYPSGKVPALRVDGDVITDSVAIMTFLADKHGALLSPAGTIARAKEEARLHRVNDELDALLWTAARHTFVLPEEHRVPEVKPSLKWEFERNLGRLSKEMGEFAVGDQFTIVDVLLTHCLNWAYSAKFPEPNADMLDYAKRMRARPAFKQVRALGKA